MSVTSTPHAINPVQCFTIGCTHHALEWSKLCGPCNEEWYNLKGHKDKKQFDIFLQRKIKESIEAWK